MAGPIEVRMSGLGSVVGSEVKPDAKLAAPCSLCGQESEVVVSVGAANGPATFACPACLRERLDAISVGRFRLRETSADTKLPWGKVSG